MTSSKWFVSILPGSYWIEEEGWWNLTRRVWIARSWGQDEDEAIYRLLKFFEKNVRLWNQLLELKYQDGLSCIHAKKVPRRLRGNMEREIPMLLL